MLVVHHLNLNEGVVTRGNSQWREIQDIIGNEVNYHIVYHFNECMVIIRFHEATLTVEERSQNHSIRVIDTVELSALSYTTEEKKSNHDIHFYVSNF